VIPFTYARAADTADALSRAAADGARYLAGGTNLVEPKTNNQEESGWAVNPSASTTESSIQTTEREYSS
jgi:CO/xanthine dehydrogenase FAD-binding subunit